MRRISVSLLFALAVGTAGLSALPAYAGASDAKSPTTASAERKGYVVAFHEPGLLHYRGGIRGLGATAPEATGSRKLDVATQASQAYLGHLEAIQAERSVAIASTLARDLGDVYYYSITLNGIGVDLTDAEAQRLAALPQVKSVTHMPDQTLDTFRGPEFIGAGAIWNGSSTPSGLPTRGEGVTIGIIDSGANRDHPSFAALPAECGASAGQPKLTAFTCMVAGGCTTVESGTCAAAGGANGPTPEDCTGHGSHVASIAAGNTLTIAGTVPAPEHNISGVAPCAKVNAYKVCASNTCSGTAIIAAIQRAIADQVDVINYSISGGGGNDSSVWVDDATADRFFLDAVNADILVAASAGNTRTDASQPATFNPTPEGDVNHRGPWLTSVASSTHDEQATPVGGSIGVTGPGPIPEPLTELVLITSSSSPHHLADNAAIRIRHFSDAPLGCNADPAYPANFFAGDTALILRGTCSFTEKVTKAEAAGASAVLVANNTFGIAGGMSGLADVGVPAYMIQQSAGEALLAYLVTLSGTPAEAVVNAPVVLGDVLSNFSLRGPISPSAPGAQGTNNSFDVTKPDITGPGDDIYGAWANEATTNPAEFGTTGGTSMSSPHVAGVYALMRAMRPDWTATEIKSAVMLTAVNADGVREDIVTPWTPDDVGSGRIDVSLAANAGLVMDETVANFHAANPASGGDVRTLNLPSLRHSACEPNCTWTRTVKSTLSSSATWNVEVDNPPGFEVIVEPATFTLASAGATQALTITATPVPGSDAIQFGRIRLETATADQSPKLALTVAVLGEGELPDALFANGFESEGGPAQCEPLQLLADPSFETTASSGGPNTSWTGVDSNSTTNGSPFYLIDDTTLSAAHDGNVVVWGGGWGRASTQTWTQNVTIPSGSPRFLNFFRNIRGLPAGTATLKAFVDGNEVSSQAISVLDTGWVGVSVDISTYADGGSHAIRFAYEATGAGTDGNVYVDSATIDCEPDMNAGAVVRATSNVADSRTKADH